MIGTVLFAVAALAAQPDGDFAVQSSRPDSPFARALTDGGVVRGQSASFTGPVLGAPQPVTTFFQTPTYDPSVAPTYTDPTFGNSVPGATPSYTTDPWVNGGTMPYTGNPYPGTAPGTYQIGLNGPQPYKFGWTARWDVGWMPEAGTNIPGGGDLEIFETNYEKELTVPVFGNWIFSAAGQYNLRLYDGPFASPVAVGDAYPVLGGTLPASPELPGSAHRFGLGLRLRTPNIGLWTFEGGFNPALATDFSSSIDSDAILYDAHAVAFLQFSPRFTVALGAQYWDRVDDIIVPYAGVVWAPNDYLELRLLFPKPRISVFIGTPFGLPTWAYVQGEYHVESYQVGFNGASAIDTSGGGLVSANELRAVGSQRVQLEDWRVVGGLYTEGPAWTSFIEAGAVLDRTVSYSGYVAPFDVDSGFLMRMGVRY